MTVVTAMREGGPHGGEDEEAGGHVGTHEARGQLKIFVWGIKIECCSGVPNLS